MFFGQRVQVFDYMRAHRKRIFEKPFIFDDPHIFDRRSWAGGTAAKG